MREKLLWVAVIVLLVGGVALGYGFYQQNDQISRLTTMINTQTPTNNTPVKSADKSFLSTFAVEKLGLQFQYPSTFNTPTISYVEDEKQPIIAQIALNQPKFEEEFQKAQGANETREGGPDNISITVYTNSEKLLPKDWVIKNKNSRYIYSNYDYVQQQRTILVDNKEAFFYSWFGLGGADEVVLADDKGLIYRISANYMVENSSIRNDLLYIIASFKLTKGQK